MHWRRSAQRSDTPRQPIIPWLFAFTIWTKYSLLSEMKPYTPLKTSIWMWEKTEFISIVGPSGCGKSTLLRIISGLIPASSGDLFVGEEPVMHPRRDIGVVFQSPVLLPWRTILENVMLPAEIQGIATPTTRTRARDLLAMVGLSDFENKYPSELSGGMQQRAAISRGLICDPEILLMDEPFGALDAMTREQMNLDLQRIWRESGKTIVLITHSIPEAVFLGDRVVVMTTRPGRIARILDVPQSRPRSLEVMGDPVFGRLCSDIRRLLYGDAEPASVSGGGNRMTMETTSRAIERSSPRAGSAPKLTPRKPPGRLTLLMRTRPELLLAPVTFVAILLIWQVLVKWLDVPAFILPPPTEILSALWSGLDQSPFSRAGYWLHTGITLSEILLGFVLGSATGLILGTIISQVRIIEATFSIFLVAIQSLPKVALAPIIVLWFGFGLTSKVVIICLLTFFPLLVNSMVGFKSVEADRIELMRAIGANGWQTFWKVRLPSAMPYIFAGLNMAAVFAVVGAVVGEFVGAQMGLGVLILSMNAAMDTAGTFSVFIILSLIGIGLHSLLGLVERRVLFWSTTARRSSATDKH